MFRNHCIKTWNRQRSWLFALAAACVSLAPSSASASANVPAVVVSSVSTVNAAGLPNSNEVNVALDACGNLYTIQSYGGLVTETPAGGGAVTTVLAGSSNNYTTSYLWIDATKSNLYVTEGEYNVYKIPLTGCIAQPGSKSSISIGNLGPVSYYWNASAVAADAAGDVFLATNVDCCGSGNELVEENAAGTTGATLLTSLTSPITAIAVDSANNLYYVSGGGLFELPYNSTTSAYAGAAVSFGSGYKTAIGVALDAGGNLFVADSGNSEIFEIPYETSGSTASLNVSDQFVVATGVSIGSSPAIDPSGNLFYTNNGAAIYEATRANANFGSIAVGASVATTLNVIFNAATTPATSGFVTKSGVFSAASGSTCTAGKSYAAGDTCTIVANFTPAVPGLSSGGLVLADSTGAAIATTSLYGVGLGAGITADPGVAAPLGTGFKTPTSVVLDVTGNLFIADPGASTVWEIASGTTTPAAIGSGLSAPTGVAVDGAGNVYIADSGNNRIVQVPVVGGALSTTAQAVIVSSTAKLAGTSLSAPAGLTADPSGNLYIADTGNNRIVFLPNQGDWNPLGAVTVGSGFSAPLATALSPTGQIYVADSGNGKIFNIPYPSSSAPQTLVATGFSDPSALEVDAAGDLFLVDKGNSILYRIPNLAGSLAFTSKFNISDGVISPYGLALDPSGNLYVTDNVNAAVYSISRTAATQSFGKWNPGSTSDPRTFLLVSSGNAPLTLGWPIATASGNTSAFTPIASESGACASGASIAVGADCILEAKFTPPDFGTYTETLSFNSNAKNAAPPQVTFNGTGATTLATSTTLAITSPAGNPYYGQAIQLSATVTATTGTPSGVVALLIDGLQAATGTLSDGAVTFSLPSGLTGGSHTLQASYEGADVGFVVYSASQSATSKLEITRDATATALALQTLYVAPASEPAGSAVTLVAAVGTSFPGIPSGTVKFVIQDPAAGTTTLIVPLTAASGGTLEATTSYTPVAPPAGTPYDTVIVTAYYSGDGNFLGSNSSRAAFQATSAVGSVVLTQSSTSLTSSATGGSSVTFTSTSYGGWQGVIGYQCVASSLPANAICLFTPGQVSLLASTPALTYTPFATKLTVVINNPPNSPAQSSFLWWLGGLLSLGLFAKRGKLARAGAWKTLLLLVVAAASFAALTAVSACGGGMSFNTPKGTSTVTVIAASDPYATGKVGNTTQPCGTNASGNTDPTLAPCAEQQFKVSLTVQ